jgi:hypothetical protein
VLRIQSIVTESLVKASEESYTGSVGTLVLDYVKGLGDTLVWLSVTMLQGGHGYLGPVPSSSFQTEVSPNWGVQVEPSFNDTSATSLRKCSLHLSRLSTLAPASAQPIL